MNRSDVNRFGEMEIFVRVVDLGGFSSAARDARMTPSAVSKLIARLEARLGTRLINRSTRKLQLTPEGSAFYERSTRILGDLEEAERNASTGETATGRIRLNTNASFGSHILAPLVPEFLAAHPGITLTIVHTDAVIDLLDERIDVAVRAGPLKSSGLVARKLGSTPMLLVASPAYLQRHGTPQNIADLDGHNRLGFCYTRTVEGWPLIVDGQPVTVPIIGSVQTSDGEALRHLALGGAGIAQLASFTVREDIKAGRLVSVLDTFSAGDREEVHAVYLGQGGHLPARIRSLLDFLAERARVS